MVKIYKVIGMSLKDKNGKLVMIDDARFDPIIDFIVKKQYPFSGAIFQTSPHYEQMFRKDEK